MSAGLKLEVRSDVLAHDKGTIWIAHAYISANIFTVSFKPSPQIDCRNFLFIRVDVIRTPVSLCTFVYRMCYRSSCKFAIFLTRRAGGPQCNFKIFSVFTYERKPFFLSLYETHLWNERSVQNEKLQYCELFCNTGIFVLLKVAEFISVILLFRSSWAKVRTTERRKLVRNMWKCCTERQKYRNDRK